MCQGTVIKHETISRQLTQALEETAESVGGFSDVHAKLDSEERQRLWTHGRNQHLVLRHVTLLTSKEKEFRQCELLFKVQRDSPLAFKGFWCQLWVERTLLSAKTRSTSSKLCWEILRLSSSDKQPSHDRHALSNNWDPPFTWGKRKCVKWKTLSELPKSCQDWHERDFKNIKTQSSQSNRFVSTLVSS